MSYLLDKSNHLPKRSKKTYQAVKYYRSEPNTNVISGLCCENIIGYWSGTFSCNDDYGSWVMDICEKGILTGSMASGIRMVDHFIDGKIDEMGAIRIRVGSNDLKISLSNNRTCDKIWGSWSKSDNSKSGSWTGTKNNLL